MHQPVPHSMQCLPVELIIRLNGHEAHVLTWHSFGDGLGIEKVILVRLEEGFYKLHPDPHILFTKGPPPRAARPGQFSKPASRVCQPYCLPSQWPRKPLRSKPLSPSSNCPVMRTSSELSCFTFIFTP